MRLPRLTIRRLLLVLAIIGLVLATVVMVRRSGEFREMAEQQADYEAGSLAYADDARGEGGDPQRVVRGEQMAAYHRALKAKYARLARYPWLPVEPGPP